MISKYVLKSFSRHKARTVIMTLALFVVTAMLVTLNNGVESLQRQIVELAEREFGEHDMALIRSEISANQFVDVDTISSILQQAHPQVKAIYPRFMTTVEIQKGSQTGNASLVARVPEDQLGQITMLEGEYNVAGDHVVLLQVTADSFGLEVGDEIDLSYLLPVARQKGYELPSNNSASRVTRHFTVSGIALATGLGGGGQNGILAGVNTVQDWLGMPGYAESLVIVLDESVYTSVNTQTSIFRVRRIAERLYDALLSSIGDVDSYSFSLDKAQMLDNSDMVFSVLRSISAVYGFLVMGVVGLLIYSIINTNVEERRRDLAFLRILGAKQHHLFSLVMIEVAVIGIFGVGLGLIGGQAFSYWVVSPIANALIANAGEGIAELGLDFQMAVTTSAMVRASLIATIVLGLSALAPARKASTTKVRYAINPGSADNIQIEDLTKLRSRKFDVRIVIAGVVLTLMWLIIFIGSNYLYVQSNAAIISVFMFVGMALLVVGVSLLFYALTIPFERLMIALGELLAPRLAFFAGPNLIRAKQRNTIISLMVVFSATLPTFLGTMVALEQRNYDITTRFDNGSPIIASIARWGYYFGEGNEESLLPSFVEELRAKQGIEKAVGVTKSYRSSATNRVALRDVGVQVYGITARLSDVIYEDLTEYAVGGPDMFDIILAEPDTIVLGAGYAEYMDIHVGDVIRVPGAGKDHDVMMRVVGLIERLPGFQALSRNENYVRWGQSPGFVSLDTYIRLTTDPTQELLCVSGFCALAERERPLITRILATAEPGVDENEIVRDLRESLAEKASVWVQSTAEDIRTTEQSMRTMRVLMLVMTALSFITSIFGVFAVVYVAVYVRRTEIGMLKAIGMRRRNLVRTFALESVMMTVSASLAGVTAGTVLGYVFYTSNNMMNNTPTQLTFDWLTVVAILVMVILASVLSAALAAKNTVRRKVTEILREAW